MRTSRSKVLAGAIFAALAIGMLPCATQSTMLGPQLAHAQNMGMRVVRGTVLDASSNPVSGATVFLQNQKTKTIRSYTSDNAGHFNFAQVNMVDDYNLWAEKGKEKSQSKTVSSWDSRTEFVTDLKLK